MPDDRGGAAERLRELQRLRDEGLITEAEFEERRARILDETFGSGETRDASDSGEGSPGQRDKDPPRDERAPPQRGPASYRDRPRTTDVAAKADDYNIQVHVGRHGGLIGLFGASEGRLVERARRRLNGRGYRIVTWREDSGGCRLTLAALLCAPLTLFLWWPRPGLIVVGEPLPGLDAAEIRERERQRRTF